MRICLSSLVLLSSLPMFGCSGSTPPPTDATAAPAAPEAAPAAPPTEPAPPPASEPEPEPEPARQVQVNEIKVEGDGLADAAVQTAFEAVHREYEACFAKALETNPDARGNLSVTLLYVKGERKSVSASYGGPGAAEINSCFQAASMKLEMSPATQSDRVVVILRLLLEPAS
jgi:hypothetical protein